MSAWHVVGSLNSYYVIFKNQFKQPQGWWLTGYVHSGALRPQKVLGLNPVVDMWNSWRLSATELDFGVPMACQVTSAVLLQKTKNNSSNNAWQDIRQFLIYIQSAGKNSDGWPNFSEFAASTPIMESEIKIQCRLFRESKTMAGQIACWQQWVEANVKKCKQL